MATESKFKSVKSWKELQTMVDLDETLQALRQAEYQKAYRSRYNKKKGLRMKLIMQKIKAGEIDLADVDAEVEKIA